MLTKKQAILMKKLLPGSSVLIALSSEYSENDEKEFKENFGATFKQAERALEELKTILQALSQ